MKHLTLEAMTTEWGKLLRVKEQTDRGLRFSDSSSVFVASNGFTLKSSNNPVIYDDEDRTLYLRGDLKSLDTAILIVPSEEWLAACRVAVHEYNETFADVPEAPTVPRTVEAIK